MLNDWQLSGIFRADSGAPYDVGFSYGSGGGVLLTGSPDYNARVVMTGDPGNGCSSNQYQQFNTGGVQRADAGQRRARIRPELPVGLQQPHARSGDRADRSASAAPARSQIRADFFNAPNAVMWNGRSTTVN